MYYKDVLPIKREEAETAFSSGNLQEICDALVRITYHDPDWRWVQAQCLYFGKHPQSEIIYSKNALPCEYLPVS